MARVYSQYNNPTTERLLNVLADKASSPELYRQAMRGLGESFGRVFLQEISNGESRIYLACTVEDADFLAKGILTQLEKQFSEISFACFWNKRMSPLDVRELKVAPILREYTEPTQKKVDFLIIVKSIISGACVVRTNLSNLISEIEPQKIFIVAPVMYFEARRKLSNEFPEAVHRKFEFFYFAQDDERRGGEVIPGIGGIVYDRLGFDGQDGKNAHTPDIVRTRRRALMARHQ